MYQFVMLFNSLKLRLLAPFDRLWVLLTMPFIVFLMGLCVKYTVGDIAKTGLADKFFTDLTLALCSLVSIIVGVSAGLKTKKEISCFRYFQTKSFGILNFSSGRLLSATFSSLTVIFIIISAFMLSSSFLFCYSPKIQILYSAALILASTVAISAVFIAFSLFMAEMFALPAGFLTVLFFYIGAGRVNSISVFGGILPDFSVLNHNPFSYAGIFVSTGYVICALCWSAIFAIISLLAASTIHNIVFDAKIINKGFLRRKAIPLKLLLFAVGFFIQVEVCKSLVALRPSTKDASECRYVCGEFRKIIANAEFFRAGFFITRQDGIPSAEKTLEFYRILLNIIEFDPDFYFAQEIFIPVLADYDIEKAIELFDRAHDNISMKNSQFFFLSGFYAQRKGYLAKAEKYLLRAIKHSQSRPEKQLIFKRLVNVRADIALSRKETYYVNKSNAVLAVLYKEWKSSVVGDNPNETIISPKEIGEQLLKAADESEKNEYSSWEMHTLKEKAKKDVKSYMNLIS